MRETPRARQAWADYLALGPDRTIERLARQYHAVQPRYSQCLVSTVERILYRWSTTHGWQSRLALIADQAAREAEEREATYRREIMGEGYALGHERVRSLKALAEKLYAELTAEGEDCRRWVRDVKQIGSGEFAERVNIERFNAAEVEQLRGLLDDIAKEKGERKQVQEISGPGGGPIQVKPAYDLRTLSDQELAIFEQLISKASGAGQIPAREQPLALAEPRGGTGGG